MQTFKDLELEIFQNDHAQKIKMNELWLEEQMMLHPVLDVNGDPVILSMNFMGIPVEFSEDVEGFELMVDT
ncbi:hypothetical protein [Halobacillus litoralis]|uniref:Uncharacterized protein n=1 Tax=Halobacillus litoralis TaxID=45668 RepID=A0A410MDM7_9BACI|nr:hypothetical protein [Halobacillus litoralis]QAS52785.1 hypothetical protein HLI_11555 [Halobacillus litoralis]